jgi:hypothetical protein
MLASQSLLRHISSAQTFTIGSRGNTGISAGAPVPIDQADERRLSRLSERSHKAARLWWP